MLHNLIIKSWQISDSRSKYWYNEALADQIKGQRRVSISLKTPFRNIPICILSNQSEIWPASERYSRWYHNNRDTIYIYKTISWGYGMLSNFETGCTISSSVDNGTYAILYHIARILKINMTDLTRLDFPFVVNSSSRLNESQLMHPCLNILRHQVCQSFSFQNIDKPLIPLFPSIEIRYLSRC